MLFCSSAKTGMVDNPHPREGSISLEGRRCSGLRIIHSPVVIGTLTPCSELFLIGLVRGGLSRKPGMPQAVRFLSILTPDEGMLRMPTAQMHM